MATNVYFGCCPNCPADFKNAANVSISSGVATFSAAQTHDLMGIGAVIDYDVDNKKMYVSGKTSTSVWSVVNADGTTPADISGKTVNSITHPFTALVDAAAAAGAPALMGGSDLVALDLILNLPQYCEQSTYTADTTSANFNGLVSALGPDPSTCVKVFTPNDTSTQCNLSMRRITKWDDTKPRMILTAHYNSCIDSRDSLYKSIYMEGLQLSTTGYQSGALRVSAYVHSIMDKCICVAYRLGDTTTYQHAIIICDGKVLSTATIIRNSILMHGSTPGVGFKAIRSGVISGAWVYAYSNIIINVDTAYEFGNAAISVFKNNIMIDTQSSNSAMLTSENNIWRENDTGSGSDIQTTQTNAQLFTDVTGNRQYWDYTILNSNSDQVNTGQDLSAEVNANTEDFNHDSGWRPQSTAWDVGAFEIFVPNVFTFITQRTNKQILKKLNSLTPPATYAAHFGNFEVPGVTDSDLNFPIGLAIDASPFIYACDSLNKRIMKIDTGMSFIDSYDTTDTIGEPHAILYDSVSGDLYVAGLYGSFIRMERITTSLSSVKVSGDLHTGTYLQYPFVTGICRGFAADTFILTGVNDDLQIVTESTSFSAISQQFISGEDAAVYHGVLVNPVDSNKIILNNGSRLLAVSNSFACVSRSNDTTFDTTYKRQKPNSLVGLGLGLNDTVLTYDARNRRLVRYTAKLNLIGAVYTTTGSSVQFDASDIASAREITIS